MFWTVLSTFCNISAVSTECFVTINNTSNRDRVQHNPWKLPIIFLHLSIQFLKRTFWALAIHLLRCAFSLCSLSSFIVLVNVAYSNFKQTYWGHTMRNYVCLQMYYANAHFVHSNNFFLFCSLLPRFLWFRTIYVKTFVVVTRDTHTHTSSVYAGVSYILDTWLLVFFPLFYMLFTACDSIKWPSIW